MNNRLPILLVSLLGGCASPGTVGTSVGTTVEPGTLTLIRLDPHAMEVRLDGTRYMGDWTDAQCFTDVCRGEFRNVQRIYRRHIRHGQAELTAQDGSLMACEWVSYRHQVRGSCQTQDGRVYILKADDI